MTNLSFIMVAFEVFNTCFVGFFFSSLPGSDEAGVGFN